TDERVTQTLTELLEGMRFDERQRAVGKVDRQPVVADDARDLFDEIFRYRDVSPDRWWTRHERIAGLRHTKAQTRQRIDRLLAGHLHAEMAREFRERDANVDGWPWTRIAIDRPRIALARVRAARDRN